MKLVLLILVVSMSGCSATYVNEQVASGVVSAITGKTINYTGAYCPTIKKQCGTSGIYEEWEQPNGKLACACN